MFTWICPKCGGEVPPAYDDCPRCNPPKPAAPAAEGTAVAATPVTSPPPPAVELSQRQEKPAAPPPPAPPLVHEGRRGLPASLVALLAFAGIAALLALLYFFVLPRQEQQRAAAEVEKAAVEQPAAAGSAAPVNPFAKHLEVTGIRLMGGSGGKMKIQYLIVNHSGAELPDMKMVVTLASGDRTYFEFPATVPSLGPYEVKDLTAALTTELKPYELPDWQMLRPRFRITD